MAEKKKKRKTPFILPLAPYCQLITLENTHGDFIYKNRRGVKREAQYILADHPDVFIILGYQNLMTSIRKEKCIFNISWCNMQPKFAILLFFLMEIFHF